MNTIGIIGNGFVGNAIYQGLRWHYKVLVYDIDPQRCVNKIGEVNRASCIFVCVPTPSRDTGEIDTKPILAALSKIDDGKLVIIKSTITPDGAEQINSSFPELKVVYNPEFLTERTAVKDFRNPKRIVLGGTPQDVSAVEQLYKKVFPTVQYVRTDFKTACFTKYFANCFSAAKVSMFNEFRQVADKAGVDWDIALEGMLASGWVNPMHTMVPGPDGKFGFGGKCFPKDLNAFIKYSLTSGIEPVILKAVWEKNLEVRADKDWLRIKGAITKGKKQ